MRTRNSSVIGFRRRHLPIGYKPEEYLCVRDEEERGFTAAAQFTTTCGSKNLPVTIGDGKREVREMLGEASPDAIRSQLRNARATRDSDKKQIDFLLEGYRIQFVAIH